MAEATKPRATAARVLFAVVAPLQRFFQTQAASGIILVVAAVVALGWANSPWRESYHDVLHLTVELRAGSRALSWPVHSWVNEALMSVFFLLAGMEIKREVVAGELNTLRRAALPLVAAAGGMVVPAGIYLFFNHHAPGRSGWGIPMATDIAFALGCMSLVRHRVPHSLFVFLTALAIFDDLGAILVIAFFYGGAVSWGALSVAAVLVVALFGLARANVQRRWPYVTLGVALWVALLRAGVHPTLAGVLLGVALPVAGRKTPGDAIEDLSAALDVLRQMSRKDGADVDAGALSSLEEHIESVQSPLDRLTHSLHHLVAFGIVPLFALANAGVSLGGLTFGHGEARVAVGALTGLVVGKTVGVFGATYLAVRFGLAPRPSHASWPQVLGASVMAGVGFTMSIFIGSLAFTGDTLNDAAKTGVLGASLVCSVVGVVLLRAVGKQVSKGEGPREAPVVVDLLRFAHGYRVEPWDVHGELAGKTLAEADLRRSYGITVIGVWRGGAHGKHRRLESLKPTEVLTRGDTLLLVGEEVAVDAFLAGDAVPAKPSQPPDA